MCEQRTYSVALPGLTLHSVKCRWCAK